MLKKTFKNHRYRSVFAPLPPSFTPFWREPFSLLCSKFVVPGIELIASYIPSKSRSSLANYLLLACNMLWIHTTALCQKWIASQWMRKTTIWLHILKNLKNRSTKSCVCVFFVVCLFFSLCCICFVIILPTIHPLKHALGLLFCCCCCRCCCFVCSVELLLLSCRTYNKPIAYSVTIYFCQPTESNSVLEKPTNPKEILHT